MRKILRFIATLRAAGWRVELDAFSYGATGGWMSAIIARRGQWTLYCPISLRRGLIVERGDIVSADYEKFIRIPASAFKRVMLIHRLSR